MESNAKNEDLKRGITRMYLPLQMLQWIWKIFLNLLHHDVLVDAWQVAATVHSAQVMDSLLVHLDQVLSLVLAHIVVVLCVKKIMLLLLLALLTLSRSIAVHFSGGGGDFERAIRRQEPLRHSKLYLVLLFLLGSCTLCSRLSSR